MIRRFGPRAASWAAAVVVSSVLSFHGYAQESAPAPAASACRAPADLIRLGQPLTRTARKVAAGDAITIVAIGSSSTAGAGASSPAHSYPSRLEVELRQHFPRTPITVINQGVNGEDAREMLDRFDRLLAAKPDLVLWQVGTNSLLLDRPLDRAGIRILDGIARLKEAKIDVVLVDSQFAPKVLSKAGIDDLTRLMSKVAKQANVPTFQRFAVMSRWHEVDGLPFAAFLSADELHMNDWSYGCIAKLLAASIVEACTRSTMSAEASAAARRP
jgi:lysophospholipase L1-like esterase